MLYILGIQNDLSILKTPLRQADIISRLKTINNKKGKKKVDPDNNANNFECLNVNSSAINFVRGEWKKNKQVNFSAAL